MWIERNLKNKLINISESRPALLLTGARQAGKSSLLKKEFPKATYITFDFLKFVQQAKENPEYFLSEFKNQVILDEIQYVPELLRNLKIKIDNERNQFGKWLMTGSQQFVLMEQISESLAGRLSIVHLETLSAKELRESSVKDFSDFIWKGGYPEIWVNKKIDIGDFFESYIKSYIERDLTEIIEVKNLTDFRRFFKVISTRVGQLINYKNISNDIGVSDVTVKKWLNALEISGLIYLLPPYYSNIGKRLVKSPKLYFADHGLLCYLLGIENMKEWINHPNRGNLWENLVFMEFIKTNNLKPGINIFFYRDQNSVEIDFVIEFKDTFHLIEAKSSETIDEKKLNFNKVKKLFDKNKNVICSVALNNSESKMFKFKNYNCFNPTKIEYLL